MEMNINTDLDRYTDMDIEIVHVLAPVCVRVYVHVHLLVRRLLTSLIRRSLIRRSLLQRSLIRRLLIRCSKTFGNSTFGNSMLGNSMFGNFMIHNSMFTNCVSVFVVDFCQVCVSLRKPYFPPFLRILYFSIPKVHRSLFLTCIRTSNCDDLFYT
jgi:predicted neutral ceramidase superfamily lipid hydrolase